MRLRPASAKLRIGAQVLQRPEPDHRPEKPGLFLSMTLTLLCPQTTLKTPNIMESRTLLF